MFKKRLGADIVSKSGGFTATITTDSVDRDGEVLIPQGMDATEFEKNPVVFWNHDYDRPIGKNVGKLKREAHSIVAETQFAVRPDDMVTGEFFPEVAKALVTQGIVRGVSIGFAPIEDRNPTKGDRAKFGDSVKRIFTMWKLLEYSLAPLPANQDALISAVQKSLVSRDVARGLFGVEVPDRKPRKVYLILTPTKAHQPQKHRLNDRRITAHVERAVAKSCGRLYLDSV